jgi:hypothetical protein
VTIIEDVEDFVRLHRAHGQLVGDATEPTLTGLLLRGSFTRSLHVPMCRGSLSNETSKESFTVAH